MEVPLPKPMTWDEICELYNQPYAQAVDQFDKFCLQVSKASGEQSNPPNPLTK